MLSPQTQYWFYKKFIIFRDICQGVFLKYSAIKSVEIVPRSVYNICAWMGAWNHFWKGVQYAKSCYRQPFGTAKEGDLGYAGPAAAEGRGHVWVSNCRCPGWAE